MEESDTYQAILEKGVIKGREEGKLEGRVEEARRNLLFSGKKRCGEPPAAILAMIQGSDDLEYLQQLFERSYEANSWEELIGTPAKKKRSRKKDG